MISIDAFLVLCGGTLTGFVGVDGLCRRMAMDGILPSFLLTQNRTFRTNHMILISFFLFCVSLFYICAMDVYVLAGVYTISFLCVMSLFCIGNLILKYKRSRLRREYVAKVPLVLLGFFACISAIIINVINDPSTLLFWILFYGFILVIVGFMFQKSRLLRMFLVRAFARSAKVPSEKELDEIKGLKGYFIRKAAKELKSVEEVNVAFYMKQPDIRLLNKAVAYVRENENFHGMKVVHVCNDETHKREGIDCRLAFQADVDILQRVYPTRRICFEMIETDEPFDGPLLRRISRKLNIRNDKMFISCPSVKFPHDIAELGGVRLVTS